MFEGQKYITPGIQANIPLYLQMLLWYMVEIMEVEEKDHLQVFELSEVIADGKIKQHILHRQEQPEYRKEYSISAKSTVKAKVYIIDDEDHCTMLMSEEY